MVIDIHRHVGTAEKLKAPWTIRAKLKAYFERAESEGIDKNVFFAINGDDHERANVEVAEIVRLYQDKLIGFAYFQP